MRKLIRSLLAVLLALALACSLTACSNTEEAPAADESAQTAVDSSLPFAGTTLTVFNWFDYIDPAVIDLFEEETGATVQYVNFTTVEEMYAKIEAGAAVYDVVFPSDYMIERMIAADMLAPVVTTSSKRTTYLPSILARSLSFIYIRLLMFFCLCAALSFFCSLPPNLRRTAEKYSAPRRRASALLTSSDWSKP